MIISIRCYIFSLFSLVSSFGFAQKECECEILPNKEIIQSIETTDSLEVFNQSKKLKQTNLPTCLFNALNLEFRYYSDLKNSEKTGEIINEQEELLGSNVCLTAYHYDLYYNKTIHFRLINDYEQLSEYVFKALKEAELQKNEIKEIKIIEQLVFLFTRMKENEKRWQYVKRAEKLILKRDTSKEKIGNLVWLAFQLENEYTKTKRESLIDSAFAYAIQSKKGALKHKMYYEITNSYRALESFSYHKGELENALVNIDSAIYYAKKIKGSKNLTGLYIAKSWDHFDLGEFEEASKWIDTALYLDRKKQDVAGYMMLLSEAAEIYEGSGKVDKAYHSYKSYSKIKDSLISSERIQIVNDLETKYQTEKKDAQIKKLIILLVAALLGIVFILFITKMIQLKKTRQKNKQLQMAFDKQIQLEKELSDVRDEIAKDFHDDLGNKLARISLLSNLVSGEVSIEDPKVKSKIKQITKDANGLYRGTRDFVFSLKSNSDYIEEIATYLSDFGEDFFSKTKIRFVVEKNIISNGKLPHYWNKQLIFIFKEALTNTLKHSQCDTVKLTFVYKNKKLNITSEDNGIGISETDMLSSNGLKNMKFRALKIGGELTIDSEKNKGTVISFIGNID